VSDDLEWLDRPAARLARACVEQPETYRTVAEIFCEHCTGDRRVLARIYAETGGALLVWARSGRGPINRPDKNLSESPKGEAMPPIALRLPQAAGDRTQVVPAICPRCRHGKLLLPQIGHVRVLGSLEPAGYGRVVEGSDAD